MFKRNKHRANAKLNSETRVDDIKTNSEGLGTVNPDEGFDFFANIVSPVELFSPDGIRLAERHIRVNNVYRRNYIIKAMPEYTRVGWLDGLWNSGNIDVSVHFVPPPRRRVIDQLTRRLVEATSQYKLEVEKRGNVSNEPDLRRAIEEIQALRDLLHSGNDRMLYTCVFVSVTANTEEELRIRCQQVEDALAAANCKAVVLEFWQDEAFKHILPLGIAPKGGIERYQYHNLLSGGASTLMPLLTADFSHQSGVFWGYNKHTQAPVFFNPFRKDLFNSHIFILGQSGSGKSVTTMLLALRQAIRGMTVIFLDPEGEYYKLLERFGGLYVRLDPSAEAVFNPLDVEPEWDEQTKTEYVDIPGKVREIAALLSSVIEQRGEKLNVDDMTCLEEAIREEYESRGITRDPESLYNPGGMKTEEGFAIGKTRKEMPTLSDVARRLEGKGADHVAFLLKPFLKGGTLGFFDGLTKVDPKEARLICFDLKPTEKDAFLRYYATQVIFMWIWEHLVKGQRKRYKALVVDEAWTFMRHPNSVTFLLNATKRGRKYRTSMTLTTQSFRDFNTDEGRNILDQCAAAFLMRAKPEEARLLASALNLSEGCVDFVTSNECGKGDGILYVQGEVAAVHVNLSRWEADMLGVPLEEA